MKTGLPPCALVLVFLVGCSKQQGSDIRTGTLDVLVTESYLPLIQRQGDEYHRIFSGAVVQVRGSTTREAIVEMVSGRVSCIVVDRRLNDEERQFVQQAELRVVETEIARDAIAIVVNSENKLNAISLGVFESIIAGKVTDWKGIQGSGVLGPIKLCLTGKNSGLYELLVRHFLKQENDVQPFFVAPAQSAVLKYVSTRPEAIGVVSSAVWRDTTELSAQSWKKSLKVLEVLTTDSTGSEIAIKLHQKNIYDLVYPLTYSLYIYTAEKNAGIGQGFSTFVAGQTGQKIFFDAGLVPKTMPYRVIQLTQE